jgi:opacity protein-like surface antigen
VNGTGGTINPYLGVLVPLPGTSNILIGPQIGFTGGNVTGSTFYPFSGGTYTTTFKQSVTVEGRVELADFGTRIRPVFNNIPTGLRLFVSAGVASVKTEVNGTGPGFNATDTLNFNAFTFSTGLLFPFNTALNAVVQYRATEAGNKDAYVPAAVPTNLWMQGINFGLELRY